MKPFPHVYTVNASATPESDVELHSARLPFLQSAPPAEFGGPGDRWSPETLLTAAVGDCFLLTFRAVARAAKLPWNALECEVSGTLDRMNGVTRFTGFELRAHLCLPEGASSDAGTAVLEKAKKNCLISNSLIAAAHLNADVMIAASNANGAVAAGNCAAA
jgi:organic hydroperoxide reductase OsmC/OhrA